MATSGSLPEDAPANRLRNRRIVITGAASGIGRATAKLFAGEGAALVLIDRDREALEEAAAQVNGHAFPADVRDESAMGEAARMGAEEMGGIDGVVAAAGIMKRGSVLDVEVAEWRRVIDINLTGTYILVRSCLPWLEQATCATIVTLGSGQGLLPNVPDRSAYAASKGGVINLTRAFAAELAPGIRANCVCPGLVDDADGGRRAGQCRETMHWDALLIPSRSRGQSFFSPVLNRPMSPEPLSPSMAGGPSIEPRQAMSTEHISSREFRT